MLEMGQVLGFDGPASEICSCHSCSERPGKGYLTSQNLIFASVSVYTTLQIKNFFFFWKIRNKAMHQVDF